MSLAWPASHPDGTVPRKRPGKTAAEKAVKGNEQ